jgi:hypothetical protein
MEHARRLARARAAWVTVGGFRQAEKQHLDALQSAAVSAAGPPPGAGAQDDARRASVPAAAAAGPSDGGGGAGARKFLVRILDEVAPCARRRMLSRNLLCKAGSGNFSALWRGKMESMHLVLNT